MDKRTQLALNVLAAQRNHATDALASANVEVTLLGEEREASFVLLESVVRSDQLTHDEVQKLIMANESFAEWYKARHGAGT